MYTMPEIYTTPQDIGADVYLRQLAEASRLHHEQNEQKLQVEELEESDEEAPQQVWPKDILAEYEWQQNNHKKTGTRNTYNKRVVKPVSRDVESEEVQQDVIEADAYYMQEIDLTPEEIAEIESRNAKKGFNKEKEKLSQQQQIERQAIYVSARGGLGTQMFQYAAVYSLARRQGRVAFVSTDMVLWNAFRRLTLQRKKIPLSVRSVKEKESRAYHKNFTDLPDKDVKVCCFLQSWRYFEDYHYSIRRQFRLKLHLISYGQGLLAKLAENTIQHYTDNNITVGNDPSVPRPKSPADFTYISVHVRVGRRLEKPYVKDGYKIAPASYIRNAIDHYRGKYKNPLFLVFSDTADKDWCASHIDSSPDVIITPTSTAEEDMAAMAQCNHTVTTTGPFSWWSGWLANGDVTYYANFTVPGSRQASRLDLSDFFPSKWISIEE